VHWFKDQINGKAYIVWKTDDNAVKKPSRIFIREINEDGITFPSNSKTTLILSANLKQEWNVVEGPWIIFKNPYYYLFYSGNGYHSPHYYTGVARSKSVTGPYKKQPVSEKDTFLHTNLDIFDAGQNSTFVGPGHGSAVRVGTDYWFIYHAWKWNKVGDYPPGRVLLLDKIDWNKKTGWPLIGSPSVTEVQNPKTGDLCPLFQKMIDLLEIFLSRVRPEATL